ncbi:hypothetical protein FB451DRAFT_1216280, partial [Mycena latifolia]
MAYQFLAKYGGEAALAVASVLRDVGPTLEVLDVSLNEYISEAVLDYRQDAIQLPRLAELTTQCSFPLCQLSIPTMPSVLLPALRRLHIVETEQQWQYTKRFFSTDGISHFAPALTHLRLSGLDRDEDTMGYLANALGLSPSGVTPVVPGVVQLPATLESLLIKPGVAPEGCRCSFEAAPYYDLLSGARRLRDMGHAAVVLLRADARVPEQDVYFQEWLEKAEGAPCGWDASRVDEEEALEGVCIHVPN